MKGKAQIILTDVRDGGQKIIHEENMFTNALDSVYSGDPYGLLHLGVYSDVHKNTDGAGLYPLYDDNPMSLALGGILAFSQPLEENANNLYAPVDNWPVAYASNDGYTGEDTRRGSFNAIESGRITNGYKFVWDFGTSSANGTIAALALTHAYGGKAYFGEASGFLNGAQTGTGYYKHYSRYWRTACQQRKPQFIGAIGDYMLEIDGSTLYKIKMRKNGLLLNPEISWPEIDADRVEMVPSIPGNIRAISGAYFYAMSASGSNVTWHKFDITGREVANGTWTFSGVTLKNDVGVYGIVDDYIYLPSNQNIWYRLNMNNNADMSNTGMPYSNSTEVKSQNLNGFLFVGNGVIAATIPHESTNFMIPKITTAGCWAVGAGSPPMTNAGTQMGATLCTPYLATINNLKNPVVKDATKTMKIVYNVTEA